MKHLKIFEDFVNESKKFSTSEISKIIGFPAKEDTDVEIDSWEDDYKTVQSFWFNIPGTADYPLYLNIFDGKDFQFYIDSAPIATHHHKPEQKRTIQQTMSDWPLPLVKLDPATVKDVVAQVKSYLNEANEANEFDVAPNEKLEKGTGFPYVTFYLSTQAADILVDFNNPKHINLIKFLIDQEKNIDKNGSLSPTEIQKGRNLFKSTLKENVSYDKFNGADCTFRLVTSPDFKQKSNSKWMETKEMEKYI
jgi:hypothetical protein